MTKDTDIQVAFERDTLEAAVREVMRLAAQIEQDEIVILSSGRVCDLKDADQVRDYLIQTSQAVYAASGRATAGAIRKIVYRTIGVVFEPIMPGELKSLQFGDMPVAPIHVAQFWQRLG